MVAIYDGVAVLVSCFGSSKGSLNKLKTSITNFDLVENDKLNFFAELKNKDSSFFKKSGVSSVPNIKFYRLALLSKYSEFKDIPIDVRDLAKKKNVTLWSREELIYYSKVANATFIHSKYEIFSSLGIKPEDIKDNLEELTYIANGVKISSTFYILNIAVPVGLLLKRSTIRRLRSVSTEEGYQRLLEEEKLSKMRDYLLSKPDAVYPSNIICTVHHNYAEISHLSKLALPVNHEVDQIAINRQCAKNLFLVRFSNIYNLFEIIDGQHRLYSYAQTKYFDFRNSKNNKFRTKDKQLEKLAKRHELIVTVIIFKPYRSEKAADLFYEINTKQTKISPEDIIDILERYHKDDPVAQANKLLRSLNSLNYDGLKGKIKFKFWETDKIKRTSLINYSGLKALYDNKKSKKSFDSFRSLHKSVSSNVKNYDDFCFIVINNFLRAIFNAILKKYPAEFIIMKNDISLKNYYTFSAVFIGALIRLSRHFIAKNSSVLALSDFSSAIKNGKNVLKLNTENQKLQAIFTKGLDSVVKSFDFTIQEFKKNGWKQNSWAQIESIMFKKILEDYPDFGDITLISKKYRK